MLNKRAKFAGGVLVVGLVVCSAILLLRATPPADAESSGLRGSSSAGGGALTLEDFAPPMNRSARVAAGMQSDTSLVEGILRADGRTDPDSNRRLHLEPGERVEVKLGTSSSTTTPVVVRADDGGVLNNVSLQPQLDLDGSARSFAFQAGDHPGLYTVSITRGVEFEVLEFWVGREPPQGRPGPSREIRLPKNIVAESQGLP